MYVYIYIYIHTHRYIPMCMLNRLTQFDDGDCSSRVFCLGEKPVLTKGWPEIVRMPYNVSLKQTV